MNTFEVNDMTCGHCVDVITKAVVAVAPGASVRIDLPTHRVTVDGTVVDAIRLVNAIKAAGYSPVAINGVMGAASKVSAPARSACCCG